MLTIRRKALLLLCFTALCLEAKPKKALPVEEPLEADVQERLSAAEYLHFTDLDGATDDYIHWEKDHRKWLFTTKDQGFFVVLSGRVTPKTQVFLNDQPVEIKDGVIKQRVGVLPEPSQVTLKIVDEKNELHIYRSIYSWLKIPPSIRLSFREEGSEQIVEKSAGFRGELKKSAFTQLMSKKQPVVAIDLDSRVHAELLFHITFPREAEESYDGWRLLILNKNQRLVAEIKRQGTPPVFIEWQEVQNKIVLPGYYTYRTDLIKGDKVYQGIEGHFDAVAGRALASTSQPAGLALEPKEEIGYFTYRNNESINRSNLYFGMDLPVIFSGKYLVRAQGLFSSLSSDPANSLTTARIGAGMRLAPETIDPNARLTGRLDFLLSYWTFGLYPSAPVGRISHASALLEPNLILWGNHYVIPSVEFSASPSLDSIRTALGMSYQFFVRPWNVKVGFGTYFESLWKHEPAPQMTHTLFRMMGSFTFLI